MSSACRWYQSWFWTPGVIHRRKRSFGLSNASLYDYLGITCLRGRQCPLTPKSVIGSYLGVDPQDLWSCCQWCPNKFVYPLCQYRWCYLECHDDVLTAALSKKRNSKSFRISVMVYVFTFVTLLVVSVITHSIQIRVTRTVEIKHPCFIHV